ncbi:MAG: universal stress protein, partial [Kiloniellaceae bacterium]
MIETIVAATDGSEAAAKAVALAADLAQKYGAKIVLVHVVDDWGRNRVPDELRSYARLEHVEITERDVRQAAANEILRRAEDDARAHGAADVESVIEEGSPATRILAVAQAHGADLIVMGSRGLGDL